MKIAVIGTGYVGLVTGTCLADHGNHVICIDKDAAKIEGLRQGLIPIYEPGLDEMVVRNVRRSHLEFTTDLGAGIADADIIFIAVGTPQSEDGSADLSGVWAVGREIATRMTSFKTIVIKSTVPVGTNSCLRTWMASFTRVPFEVANNPEFLKEGSAIQDFNHPDRVVVGVRTPEVADTLATLYQPFVTADRPFLAMSPESAEMTKYVANCLLATKISFINEMANLATAFDAVIDDVRQGIGFDRRIGFSFLSPGVGYGGSCFPKDVRALTSMAREVGVSVKVMTAVDEANEAQKLVIGGQIFEHFRNHVEGKTVAIWGLAFKPETDDIRESPALVLIDQLLEGGAHVRVSDPEAMPRVREIYGDRLSYFMDRYEAIEGTDALALVTDWSEFSTPDFPLMATLMNEHVIFDGRNFLDPNAAVSHGFLYHGIGRPTIEPEGWNSRHGRTHSNVSSVLNTAIHVKNHRLLAGVA